MQHPGGSPLRSWWVSGLVYVFWDLEVGVWGLGIHGASRLQGVAVASSEADITTFRASSEQGRVWVLDLEFGDSWGAGFDIHGRRCCTDDMVLPGVFRYILPLRIPSKVTQLIPVFGLCY